MVHFHVHSSREETQRQIQAYVAHQTCVVHFWHRSNSARIFPSRIVICSCIRSALPIPVFPLLVSFTVKWLFITPLRRYNKLSIRTAIFFMITIIKLGLLLLISLWYVTVKLHDRPNVLFSNLDVEKPWTFIPTFIWPEPHPWLEKLALKRESGEEVPLWAQCDRSDMFCNGTFVTAT